jgi:hypothetical protein
MANKKDKKFPGYPHYPASEDIMNSSDNERVDLNVENLSRSGGTSTSIPDKSVRPPQAEEKEPVLGDVDDDTQPSVKSDADLTEEDLIALGETEAEFNNAETISGDDLDVPGSEDDDENEEIGEEDEENNYYSLGGEAHENLEEDKGG